MKDYKKQNEWMMKEKHYITKKELEEYAKEIWKESTTKRINVNKIKNLASTKMVALHMRDKEYYQKLYDNKSYITQDELIEFAKEVSKEATGSKCNLSNYALESFAYDQMLELYWKEND